MSIAEGPLSWPQENFLMFQPAERERAYELNLPGVVEGRGVRLAEALDAVADTIARYDALRTTLEFNGATYVWQRVDPPESVRTRLDALVEVIRPDQVEETFERTRLINFDICNEWPLRVVIVEHHGAVGWIGLLVDHSAVDGWGMNNIRRHLDQALTGFPDGAPPARSLQPLDLAAWERSDAGSAQIRDGLRFLAEQFVALRAEVDMDSQPPTVPPGVGEFDGPYRNCRIRSTRLLSAARAAAARARVPLATMVLTAYGAAICEVADTPATGTLLFTPGRLSPEAAASVSNMAMSAPVLVRRPEGGDLTRSAAHCLQQSMRAHQYGHVDPVRRDLVRGKMLPEDKWVGVAAPLFNFVDLPTWGVTESLPVPEMAGDLIENLSGNLTEEIVVDPLLRPEGPALLLNATREQDALALDLMWGEHTRWHGMGEPIVRRMVELLEVRDTVPR